MKRNPPQKKKNQWLGIGAVSIVSLVIFSIFLVLGPQFVGKAIEVEGIYFDLVQDGNTLFVKANLVSSINAAYFELYSEGLCDKLDPIEDTVINHLGWGDTFYSSFCEEDTLFFSDGSLTESATDSITIAELKIEPSNSVFAFLAIDLYDSETAEDIIPDNVEGSKFTFAQEPTPPTQTSSGGGGGYSCRSNWVCGEPWGYCDENLIESRVCRDTSSCNNKDRTETRTCLTCEESWTCSTWSLCSGGKQTRTCVDEHACATNYQKPDLQKSCSIGSTGTTRTPTAPDRTVPTLPVPRVEQPAPGPSFMQMYKPWLIGAGSGLLLLVIVLVLILAFHPHKAKLVYNLGDLQTWVKQERAAGTTDSDIRTIIQQKTSWDKEQVDLAMR
jgi:hypothetical protein